MLGKNERQRFCQQAHRWSETWTPKLSYKIILKSTLGKYGEYSDETSGSTDPGTVWLTKKRNYNKNF
jgi:hypothetical protein